MKSSFNSFLFPFLICGLSIGIIYADNPPQNTSTISTAAVTKSYGGLKLKTDGPFKPENFGLNDPITKTLFGTINGAINLVIDCSKMLIEPFTDKGGKLIQDIEESVGRLAAILTHLPMSVEDLAEDLDDVKTILSDLEDSFQELQGVGMPLSLVPAIEAVRFNIDAAIPAINIVAGGLHIVAQG